MSQLITTCLLKPNIATAKESKMCTVQYSTVKYRTVCTYLSHCLGNNCFIFIFHFFFLILQNKKTEVVRITITVFDHLSEMIFRLFAQTRLEVELHSTFLACKRDRFFTWSFTLFIAVSQVRIFGWHEVSSTLNTAAQNGVHRNPACQEDKAAWTSLGIVYSLLYLECVRC
jgi:hypothetical protein